MERIEFIIHCISDDMCRITCNSALSEHRKITDGGCIMSLDILLYEMQEIKRKTKKYGKEAIFIISERR